MAADLWHSGVGTELVKTANELNQFKLRYAAHFLARRQFIVCFWPHLACPLRYQAQRIERVPNLLCLVQMSTYPPQVRHALQGINNRILA